MGVRIGVGITTHNRSEVVKETHRRWLSVLPKGAKLVVVDDASVDPYPSADYRFDQNVGIARSKNKCLELLDDCTDVFLADDDVFPVSSNWWRPYVDSPEPHLSYQFVDLIGPVKLHDMAEVYRDAKHVAYTSQRGCLLYFNRICMERVGGFDPVFGRALYEHSDLANRIHDAGLTTWRYADIVGSEKLWHSMDEYAEIKRTAPNAEYRALAARNKAIHDERRRARCSSFVPYRENPEARVNVVLTSLLQDSNERALVPWLEVADRSSWNSVVLSDSLKKLPIGYETSLVKVESSTMNTHYQRWLHVYQYLRAHPEVRWVWCVDNTSTSAERLGSAFVNMAPGKLHVYPETQVVGAAWMRRNHPAETLQKFIRTNETKRLLNAGIVGGDRATVQELARLIVSMYADIETDRFLGKEAAGSETGDMAAFNKVAYEQFGSRLVFRES